MTLSKGGILAGWIAAILLYGALSPRFLPGEKEMIAALPFLAMLLSIGGRAAPRWPVVTFACLAVTSLGGLLFQERLYPSWIVSSMVTIAGILFFTYATYRGVRFLEGRNLRLILWASVIAAIIAPLSPDPQDFNRFEPPNFLLFGVFLALAVGLTRRRHRLIALLILLACLALSYHSQWRIVFVLQLAVVAGVIVTRRPLMTVAVAVVFGLILAGYTAFGDAGFSLADWVGPRYQKILTYDGFVAELGVRFIEVRDVAAQIQRDGNAYTTLFGFGHGATFFAQGTLSELGSGLADWQARFTDSDHAFTIHFGPVRIYFRYGIVGLLGWAALFWLAAVQAVMQLRRPRAEMNIAALSGGLCCLMFLARSLFQPVEHEYVFWIGIALFFLGRRGEGQLRMSRAQQRQLRPVAPRSGSYSFSPKSVIL